MALANITVRNKILDVSLDASPMKLRRKTVISPSDTPVPTYGTAMEFSEQVWNERGGGRQDHPAFVTQGSTHSTEVRICSRVFGDYISDVGQIGVFGYLIGDILKIQNKGG